MHLLLSLRLSGHISTKSPGLHRLDLCVFLVSIAINRFNVRVKTDEVVNIPVSLICCQSIACHIPISLTAAILLFGSEPLFNSDVTQAIPRRPFLAQV